MQNGFIEGTALTFEIDFIESYGNKIQLMNKIHIIGDCFSGIRNMCGISWIHIFLQQQKPIEKPTTIERKRVRTMHVTMKRVS